MNSHIFHWPRVPATLGCAFALAGVLTPCHAGPVSSSPAASPAAATSAADATSAAPPSETPPAAGLPSDAGVDIGIVKTTTALFLRPNIHPTHIAVLQPGDRTILVSRTPVTGWMNVIQASSGHQGWVRASSLTLHLTDNAQPKAELQSTPVGGDNLPVLSVTNSTGLPLYLHLSQLDEIQISPHETKDITLPAGVHAFNAAIANAVPLFGYNEFPKGNKYSWNFVLTAGPQHAQTQSVSPETRTRIQQLQDAVDALQAQVKDMAPQIAADKAAVAQQQAQLKTDTDALDAKKAALDQSNAAAVADLNTLTDRKNTETVAIKSAEDALNAKIDQYNTLLTQLKSKRQELASIAGSINKQP